MKDTPPHRTALSESERRRAMRRAVLTQFFGVLGMQSFENGVLLLYLTALNVPAVRILTYLALPNAASMLFRLPIAYAGDRRGKKPMGTVGVSLTALGYAALPVAGFLPPLQREILIVSGILVLALGKTLFAAGWHAMIGGIVPHGRRGRFYGRMRMWFRAGGIAFTLLVAGILVKDSALWKYQAILAALVVCFFLRVVFYVQVPEVERSSGPAEGFWAALGQVLRHSSYVSFCAYVFLLMLFTKGALNLFALVEKEFMGLGSGTVVLLANVSMAGGLLGFAAGGPLVDRYGTRYVFLTCHLAFVLSMLGFVLRNSMPLPALPALAVMHCVFGAAGAASGIAISTEMLTLAPVRNRALSTSLCLSLLLGGAALSGLIAAGILNLGILRDTWTILGHTVSSYDAVLFGYGIMVLLLVVTLGLVPSVLGAANRPAGESA